MLKIKKYSLYDISVIYMLFAGLFSSSKYGVSFSWVTIPAIMLVGYTLFISHRLVLLRAHIFALFLYIVGVISTVMSPVVSVERDIFTNFFFTLLFVFVTGCTEASRKERIYIICYLLIGVTGSICIISNFFSGIYYNSWFQRSSLEFMGVSRDPNYVGAYLAPIAILSLVIRPFHGRRFEKIFIAVTLLASYAALFILGSRGAIVSSVIPVALYMLLCIKTVKGKITAVVLAVISLMLGEFLMYEFLPEQAIVRLFEFDENVRLELWGSAMSAFQNNPIIGQGYGASTYYSFSISGNDSHSMYIDILASLGILGMLSYLALVFCVAYGNKKIDTRVLLIGIALFLPQFFLNGFNTLSMWIPIFMLFFAKHYLQKLDILNS